MLKNYLKVAFRNVRRQKGYSFINIAGLTLGLACCLIIMLYVRYEFSYDRFHQHADRIYRVVEDRTQPEGRTALSSASGFVGPALVRDLPEILHAVRFKKATMLMAFEEKRFQEDEIFFTDSTVFGVFSFPLLTGHPQTALTEPFSIVLTEETALRYFGQADPVGQTLMIDDRHPFRVTGVLRDIPANSHIRFDMLLSMSTMEAVSPGWSDARFWSAHTYILLAPGYDEANLLRKLPQFIDRYDSAAGRDTEHQRNLALQALPDIHLHSNRIGELGAPGSIPNLYLFSLVAIFILVVACINFINLTTAQAARRAKEVGLRKTLGGTRMQLTLQFLGEPILLSLGASILALNLGYLLLPAFSGLVGVQISLDLFATPWTLLGCLGTGLAVGCLAGIYPAFVLSGFHPGTVLKGRFIASRQGSSLRKGLVVFQFIISIALVAGTATVFSQIRHMQEQKLGFDREQVLVLYFGDDMTVQQQAELIKRELLRASHVRGATASSQVPGKEPRTVHTEIRNATGALQAMDINLLAVDYDFIPFYHIGLVAGRTFSSSYASDSTGALLINETAARELGFNDPEEAVGREFSQDGRPGHVIGVVKDFHYMSLHQRIEPLVIRMRHLSLSYLSLRIASQGIGTSMDDLQGKWQALAPHRPLDYFFLDEQFDQQYRSDRQFGRVFGIAAIIAITLASLGLLALAAFTIERRTKEVGVRKVLGATIQDIVSLLLSDFLKLVGIAFLAATPVAYFAMHRWLEGFPYRIKLGPGVFVFAGVLAFITALLTVGYQAVRAGSADPVKSLRQE